MLEGIGQVERIDDEDTSVPIELATLHKHRSKFALRLLGKRLDAVDVGLAAQFT